MTADFTYQQGVAIDPQTSRLVEAGSGVFRDKAGGTVQAMYDLLGNPIVGILLSDIGVHAAFKADLPRGVLTFGSVDLPAVSIEAIDASLEAQAAKEAAEAALALTQAYGSDMSFVSGVADQTRAARDEAILAATEASTAATEAAEEAAAPAVASAGQAAADSANARTEAQNAASNAHAAALAAEAARVAAEAAAAAEELLPPGGTDGQALVKISNADGDVDWENLPPSLPLGGTDGQALFKITDLDGDANWENLPPPLPPGGVDGQVLTKISNADGDANWEALPAGGGGGGSAVLEPLVKAIVRRDAVYTTSTTGVPIPWEIVEVAPQGVGWDGTKYTIQTAGLYLVSVSMRFNPSVVTATGYIQLRIYKATTGYDFTQIPMTVAGVAITPRITRLMQLEVGDQIGAGPYTPAGTTAASLAANNTNAFEITKVPELAPGGGGVVVERPVAVSRRQVSSVPVANTTSVTIPFDTEDFTEGGWSFAAGVFTVPVDGLYQVNAKVNLSAATGVKQITLLVNGSPSGPGIVNTAATSAPVAVLRSSRMLRLVAGDTVMAQAWQNSGAAGSISASPTAWTSIDITKVPAAYAGSAVSTYGERNYSPSGGSWPLSPGDRHPGVDPVGHSRVQQRHPVRGWRLHHPGRWLLRHQLHGELRTLTQRATDRSG